MAEAIGAAILSAVGTTAAVSTTVGIAGVSIATIVGTTTLISGSLAISALTAPDTKQRVAAQQFSSRQSLPTRRRAYGRVKLAGPKVEYRSYGGTFTNAIYHVEGPIGGYDGFWLSDTQAKLAVGSLAGPAGVAPWLEAVRLEGHLGTADQAASSLLGKLPTWSSADRLAGCAYSVMQAVAPAEKNFKRVFTSGTWPEHRVLIRASLVWDLRDSNQNADPASWRWTDRVTPCIRDLVTHKLWGMKVPDLLIDEPSWKASTDVDDETVTTRSGERFPRWFLGGAYDLTEDPAVPLQAMMEAGDKRLYLTPAGRIGISGGRYVAPDVTIGHDSIVSMGEIEVGSGKRASFNRLKISYVSPHHDYQVIEGDPWEDQAAQAEAGEILEADFSRPWVQNHYQLRRLAKIHTRRMNPDFRITGLVTNRGGVPALFEDVIHLDLPRYGISLPFEIQRAVGAGDGSRCTFDLVSIDPAAWADDPADEGVTPPIPGQDADPAGLPAPVNLAVAVERRAVNAGTNAVFLRLTADQPEREDLTLIGRYRASGATDWLDMSADGASRGSVVSSVLADGVDYEAQGAIAGYQRAVQSGWVATNPAALTATADTISPGRPSEFTAKGGTGQVSASLIAPNAPNFGFVRIFRGGPQASFAQAVAIQTVNGAPSQGFDVTAAGIAPGAYRLWVRAFNRSGFPTDPADLSSTTGPLAVTVT